MGPMKKTFSPSGSLAIEAEIQNLLSKGIIVPAQHESGEYISPVFVTEKKDGSHRMIFNLKSFNKHLTYYHFKMDSVWTAIRLLTPNCYMASIDLKDAYYSVPIANSHQKISTLSETIGYFNLHAAFPMSWQANETSLCYSSTAWPLII